MNDIRNEQDAQRWIAAWDGRPRPGVCAAVLSGLETALSIMNSAPQRYTVAERVDTLQAIAIIKFA